jgi:hypothetical protein
MKVVEGDALFCISEECKVELVLMAASDSKTCDVECDIEVSCHANPMKVINKWPWPIPQNLHVALLLRH